MNRQEIELNIELLKGNVDGFKALLAEQPHHPMGGSIEHQIDALEMAIFALTQQLNNGWIPVSKKMPEFDQNCLVTTDSGEIFTSKFFGYGEECQGYREYPEGVWEVNQCELEVTAWQPLPEPWKEISNDRSN